VSDGNAGGLVEKLDRNVRLRPDADRSGIERAAMGFGIGSES
jgi:hypothetical protein